MTAALEAWGSSFNLFHHELAQQTDDEATIATAMAKPGVVLRRPVGTDEPKRRRGSGPDIPGGPVRPAPCHLQAEGAEGKDRRPREDHAATKAAASAFERERRRTRGTDTVSMVGTSRSRALFQSTVQPSNGPFPLDHRTMHLCVDMQRVFMEDTPWCVAWMPRILPAIEEIAARHAARTIFTLFTPPVSPGEARGAWKAYFEAWPEMTGSRLDPALVELVAPLRRLVPPARALPKPANSAFERTELAASLRTHAVTTLVVTGAETDVCVLATVMDAVDKGYRVVLPTDALCSSRDSTHDALLKLYRERYSQQIETTTAEDVLARWKA